MKSIYPTQSRAVLMPRFAADFDCIGSACELSCCRYFRITFERKFFQFLEQDLHLSDKTRYKKLPKSQRSEVHFAEFLKQGAACECRFLEEGWCALHRDFGETAIPNVCYLHPRVYRSFVPEHLELSLSISCPEAARLALLRSDAFDFIEQTLELRTESIEFLPHSFMYLKPLLLEVRFFCVQILRVQDLLLWKRLSILLLFCSHLAEAFSSSSVQDAVQNLIEGTTYLIQSGEAQTSFDAIEARDDYLAFCYVFLKTVEFDWQNQPHFADILQVLNACCIDEQGAYALEVLHKNYQKGLKNLSLSLQNHPYFFEHLVLAEMLELSFPFDVKTQMPLDFVSRYLCFVYLFMRFVLALYCKEEKKMPEDLALVVAKFMRFIQHVDLKTQAEFLDFNVLGWENLNNVYAHLKEDFL